MEALLADFEKQSKPLVRFVPEGPPAYNPYFTTTIEDHPAYFNQLAINCYSYALNILGHGWGIPGRLKEEKESELKGEDFQAGYIQQMLVKDGCQPIAPHGCSRKDHFFAFTMSNDDFPHFTVYQEEGFFAGKRSQGRVEIVSPDMADFRPENAICERYNRFIGFYMVPKSGITYCLREPPSQTPYDLFI